jgi:hypothetical protein
MDSAQMVDTVSARSGKVAPVGWLVCRLIVMGLAYATPALALKVGQEIAAHRFGDNNRPLSESLDPKHDKDHDEDRGSERGRVHCCSRAS